MDRAKIREQAWVGDAVLALYARRWLLANRSSEGAVPREILFKEMTNNAFLAGLGEPTSVEAAIGRCYEANGLEAAFAHIEATILPHFLKQEQKRQRGHQGQKRLQGIAS